MFLYLFITIVTYFAFTNGVKRLDSPNFALYAPTLSAGTKISAIFEHSWNGAFPFIYSGGVVLSKVTVISAVQYANYVSPKLLIFFGIVSSVKFLQELKASFPMLSRVFGNIKLEIYAP